jgi:hypothetical protein
MDRTNARYHVEVIWRDQAKVDEFPLIHEDGDEGPFFDETSAEATITPPQEDAATSRRIVRATIVNNIHEQEASVQVTICHQRRHKTKEPWQDVDSFSLSTLKGGEEARLKLDATETWRLREALNHLYGIGRNGVPLESGDYIAVPAAVFENNHIVPLPNTHPDEFEVEEVTHPFEGLPQTAQQVMEELQAQHGDQVWQWLAELNPDLLLTMARKKIHEKRLASVQQFEQSLNDTSKDESYWQKFFEENTWIFGHGLRYCILRPIQPQADVGGRNMDKKGSQVTDFLMTSVANVGFTVLVDIKTPHKDLVNQRPYRNGAHAIGNDVSGGVAQLHANCRTWDTEGARRSKTLTEMSEKKVVTIEPEGILVVGNTAFLDTPEKRESFSLFRSNLHNPKIITFDELLERAKYIVSTDDPAHP